MLFAWLKPRPQLPPHAPALAFLRALAGEAELPFTVLAAAGRGGMQVASFGPRSAELVPWLAKRTGQRLFVLTAQAAAPLSGRAISAADLVQTRIVGVTVPARQAARLTAFRPAPAIIAETPQGLAGAWRLRNPAAPEKARSIAGSLAAHLGGVPLEHLFPLPGCGGTRLVQHLKGTENWTLVTELDAAVAEHRATETAASEPLFAPADSFKIEPTDWLWPDVIACGDLTLLGGAPGMGKSQMAIYAAAVVSSGGTWPDGSRAKRGSIILCETEDRPGQAIRPRLEAAGADLSRVHFGRHMDLSTSMAALAAQAEALPDLRLLVLSPVLTFFGATSNDENTVRGKLRPMLEWAAARNIAALGIIHPLKNGPADAFAGCDAYRRASRAAWRLVPDPADSHPIEKMKRRVLLAAKANNAPDALRLLYRIEGVTLPGGIGTSRIVFPQERTALDQPDAETRRKWTVGEAEKAVLELLEAGPVDSASLAHIPAGTLSRAAARIHGVVKTPIPGTRRLLWTLEG